LSRVKIIMMEQTIFCDLCDVWYVFINLFIKTFILIKYISRSCVGINLAPPDYEILMTVHSVKTR